MTYHIKNKLLNWIEGRLTNLKESGEILTTEDLIREASLFYKINYHPLAVKKLKEQIAKIRGKIDIIDHEAKIRYPSLRYWGIVILPSLKKSIQNSKKR